MSAPHVRPSSSLDYLVSARSHSNFFTTDTMPAFFPCTACAPNTATFRTRDDLVSHTHRVRHILSSARISLCPPLYVWLTFIIYFSTQQVHGRVERRR